MAEERTWHWDKRLQLYARLVDGAPMSIEYMDTGQFEQEYARLTAELEAMREERDALAQKWASCGKDNCFGLEIKGLASWVRKDRLTAAESALEALKGKAERWEAGLTIIAVYDDKGGNSHLEATGSYGAFDDPGAVEVARKALTEVEGEEA